MERYATQSYHSVPGYTTNVYPGTAVSVTRSITGGYAPVHEYATPAYSSRVVHNAVPYTGTGYGGTVVNVEYVTRDGRSIPPPLEAGPLVSYAAPPVAGPLVSYAAPSVVHSVIRPAAYVDAVPYVSNTLPVPRSYPARVAKYEDRFDAPPRYDPPPPPPRYTPPPSRYDPGDIVEDTSNLRPWVGVALKWLDDLDNRTGGGKDSVAVVHEVIPGSPADKAGVRVDDQLEFWTTGTSPTRKIDSESVWKDLMKNMKIGDMVKLGIHRNHQDQNLTMHITGTDRSKGGKRVVQSANAVHTDNFGDN